MSVKVKICGLREPEHIKAAVENGADFIGFVFFDKSPRNITPKKAGELAKLAREFNSDIKICAVCVNPSDELIDELGKDLMPDYLQIHKANIERIKELKARDHKIIHAIGVSDPQDIENAKPFFGIADYILFDAKAPKGSTNEGGFGISFDWSILGELPKDLDWFLSGGLNPENVKSAIAATNALNVDVSSGIESSLGIKDAKLIEQFLKNAKG